MDPTKLPSGKILIIDDQPEILDYLISLLTANGYQVQWISEGQAALGAVRAAPPDLILLDIVMPDMNGHELCQRLQADEQSRQIPVIFISGLDEIQAKTEAFAAGGVDYLTKPFEPKEVLARVETHLALRTARKQLKTRVVQLEQEIAERMRAEAAVRVSEEKYRELIENAGESIYSVDKEGVFLMMNTLAAKSLGGEPTDFLGKTMGDLFPPDIADSQMADIRRVIQSKTPLVSENMSVLQGEPRWYRTHIQPLIDPAGHCSSIQAISHDITERKQMEEALQEYSERLEEMVEERTQELRAAQERLVRQEKLAGLGQMAGSVAHELRNPLGVLNNAVYFLKTVLADSDETVQEYLEIISSQIRKSDKIVTDLLGFSHTRLTEKTEREAVAVSELATRVLAEQPLPEQVEASTQLAPDLPPVLVNPQQIGQVLTNLVVNAYQAMPGGGRLTISAAAQENEVVISVHDTGVGIPAENLDKLFEPLFTTKAKGIGLGLAVSRNLLEANGGRVEVESEEGYGSTFTLFLPAKLEGHYE